MVNGKTIGERLEEVARGALGEPLSAAERRELETMLMGWKPKDSARRHRLSVETTQGYRKSILSKCGCHSSLELLAKFYEAYLPPPEDTHGL